MRALSTWLASLAWIGAAWAQASLWAPLGSVRWTAALGAALGAGAAARINDLRLRLGSFWLLLAGLGSLSALAQHLAQTLEWPSRLLGPEPVLLGSSALAWAVGWALLALGVRVTARRVPLFIALEALLVCSGMVGLLAGHRQGFINRPYFLVDPLWSRGYDPLPFFLALGAAMALTGLVVCSSYSQQRRSPVDLGLLTLVLVMAFLLLPVQRLKDLPQIQASQGKQGDVKRPGAHGSPQGSPEPGKSPGDSPFQDQSSPPPHDSMVAVVLFKDDYQPQGGYFYFRESSTSQYNGVQLIRSTDSRYDRDLADRFPVSTGRGSEQDQERLELPSLTGGAFQPLETEVCLLSQHARPFGLVNAELMWAQANPDPNRFQKAYSVRSQVLMADLKELFGCHPGDSKWDQETWNHYTDGPKDKRYENLAREILEKLPQEYRQEPFYQAVAIKLWLDENCTYSLASHYADSKDPVADFLFGDRTGYCVFLSHSACYLWRSLGIPARICEGYAVAAADKGQGSALLIRGRNSHSWPEVYLEGYGWMPLDISPHKSLVPAEDPVDSSLQQMMGDMARQQPPPDRPQGKIDLQQLLKTLLWGVLSRLPYLLGLLLALAYAVKISRRLAPYLVPERRLPVAALRSLLDQLAERGITRSRGQSREAFSRSLAQRCPSLAPLTLYNLAAHLSPAGPPAMPRKRYLELLAAARKELAAWPRPWYQKVAGWLDPIPWWRVH